MSDEHDDTVANLQRMAVTPSRPAKVHLPERVARAGTPPEGYEGKGVKPRPVGKDFLDTFALEAAEAKLQQHGAVKIVSLWWSDPYVVGVLADGRRVIVSEPTHMASEPPEQGPPEELIRSIREGVAVCSECMVVEQERRATTVAYCCGLKRWLPVCEEHAEEMGDGGPEDCS